MGHFNDKELRCKCCGQLVCTTQLLAKLEALREAAGQPVIINCAYRCPKHNREVGGVINSYHCRGMAADVRINGLTPIQVAELAAGVGFTGIGVYETFTHVDVREKPAHWRG